MSTGLDALDATLGGLYWPFYLAIASQEDAFDTKTRISLGGPAQIGDIAGLGLIEAGAGSDLVQPADLLLEIHRLCHPHARRLLLFDSLDQMVDNWGVSGARGFFARCCPLLLEVGAIAYWSMTQETPAVVRDTVEAVTQCVLRVDERSVRVAKAEGRDERVRGSVLHWHEDAERLVLAPAEIAGRIAASLRALRRARELSQHDLAKLAGVTASAISQAERDDRGLSLGTLVRLSAALGITIDELLRGEDPAVYRIGRRTEDPEHGLERTLTLLGGDNAGLLHRPCPPQSARIRLSGGRRKGDGDRRRGNRSCTGAGRRPDACHWPWRGVGCRKPAGRWLAQPRANRGRILLDHDLGRQLVLRPVGHGRYTPS